VSGYGLGVYTRPGPQDNEAGAGVTPVSDLKLGLSDTCQLRGIAMKPATAPGALKVQAAPGPELQVLELEASTRTSEEAAAAVGTPNVAFRIARPI
jgi:hypothetical protein